MLIAVKFEGGLADAHRIPAYEGTKSLGGLTRSILIVSNFLVEGRVRRKEFGRVPLVFDIVANRPGSFETIYDVAYNAAVIGAPLAHDLAAGVAGNLLTDLLKTVYRRVTGGDEAETPASVSELEVDRGGDVAALIDAVEPSVRLGHNVINYGVINININTVSNPGSIAEFNSDTKRYMWENVIDNNIKAKLFSVSSFNANQGTGRAYDLEEGRSIPFELIRGIDRESVSMLLSSIGSYAMRRQLGDNLRSSVAIKYTSVDALDGRVKKIRIISVRRDLNDL